MHTLIITDELKHGLFLQKGLHFENVPTLLLNLASDDTIKSELVYSDGVFLAISRLEQLEPLIKLCRIFKNDMPIVMLAYTDDKKLKAAADQHQLPVFCRPFPLRIIANYMKTSIFRAKETMSEEKYIFRDLEVDVNNHEVKYKNEPLYLRNKEFSLLHFFIANRGKILSRSTILESVWDRNADFLTNTVEVHISSLRKKIEKNNDSKYIHTIPCTGYMLN